MSDDNRVWKHCPCSIPCSWLNDLLTNYLIAGSSNLPPKHILVMLIKKTALASMVHHDTYKVGILLK